MGGAFKGIKGEGVAYPRGQKHLRLCPKSPCKTGKRAILPNKIKEKVETKDSCRGVSPKASDLNGHERKRNTRR